MVKIIIELDENYIEQRSNPDNLDKLEGGGNPLRAFADILSFGMINSEVKGGKTEFPVNRELLDDNGKQLFDNTVTHFCALAGIMKKKEEKKEE